MAFQRRSTLCLGWFKPIETLNATLEPIMDKPVFSYPHCSSGEAFLPHSLSVPNHTPTFEVHRLLTHLFQLFHLRLQI